MDDPEARKTRSNLFADLLPFDADNDILFDGNTSISRVHAKFTCPPVENVYDLKTTQTIQLQDWFARAAFEALLTVLGVRSSKFGTFVDGKKCPATYVPPGSLQRAQSLVCRPVEVKDGSLVQFGTSPECMLRFVILVVLCGNAC